MNSNTLRQLITLGMAVTGMLVATGTTLAASQTTVVSGGGARPSQPIYTPPGSAKPTPPIYYPPGTARPEPPIYYPPGTARPEPPIYRPPGTIGTNNGGWVDTSQQFGLPCPGSTSIIAGTIYYVCGDRYFLEEKGPNGSTFVQVPSPL